MCHETKICIKCNIEKPLAKEFFNKKKENKDGWNNTCTKCKVERNKQLRILKPEQYKATQISFQEKHGKRIADERRLRKQSDPEYRSHVLATAAKSYRKRIKPKPCGKCGKLIYPGEKKDKYCIICVPDPTRSINYYRLNPEKYKEAGRIYEQQNRPLVNKRQNEGKKRAIDELTDGYIVTLIRGSKYPGLTLDKVPKEMIETKRLTLLIKRELKQQENGSN